MLSTGATLHLGPIRLHIENWECCALKSSARCQKFGVLCRFFSACKWGFSICLAAKYPAGSKQVSAILPAAVNSLSNPACTQDKL